MTQQIAKRYALDSIKARALTEAERAQIATQNYINQLGIRASELENQAAEAEKELTKLKETAIELRDSAVEAKESADKAFKKTLSEVVESFGLEPPWKVAIVYSEGVAVGLDITKEESPAEPGQVAEPMQD